MTIQKLGLALAVSALKSSAHAVLYTTTDDAGNTGGSSLLLAAYDAAAATTLYVDLNALAPNMRVHTFDANANQSIDLSAVAAANNFSLDNVRWAVVGGDWVFSGGACHYSNLAACGSTFIATVSANETLSATATTASINSVIGGVNNGWFLTIRGAIDLGNGTSTTVADGNFGEWNQGLAPAQHLWDVMGATGESLAFAAAIPRIDPTMHVLGYAPYGDIGYVPGYWTLDNKKLTYSVASVPVPAAAWLFASGLAGLVGAASRRRKR
jgi:hypothetical protein